MRPGDDSTFDDQFGLRTKVFGFPHDQIGQTALRDLANDMRHSMGDSAGISAVSHMPDSAFRPQCSNLNLATYGLMVYFAIYRFTRTLSFLSESPSSDPLTSRILEAVRQVLETTSPIRPIA